MSETRDWGEPIGSRRRHSLCNLLGSRGYYRGLQHKGNKISHALSILCNTPICECTHLHTPAHKHTQGYAPPESRTCRTRIRTPHESVTAHTSRVLKYRSGDGFSPQPTLDVNDVSHARPMFSYACGDLLVYPLTHKSRGVIQGYKPGRGGVKPGGGQGGGGKTWGSAVHLSACLAFFCSLPFLLSS